MVRRMLVAFVLGFVPVPLAAGQGHGETKSALEDDPNLADADGDYLTDAQEQALGTDPARADTDADGLPDASEVGLHRTDPLIKDSDGGGTTDGEEVLLGGTDPTDPSDDPLDSDQDGLPNRVEIGLGTDPFSADTDADLLLDGIEDANRDGMAAGDGHTPFVFEPALGDETDPRRADSDGDGLSDGLERLVFDTDPFQPDSDGDGLADGQERNLQMSGHACIDPREKDSDFDGLSDGWELDDAHPSDPCDADSDHDRVYDVVETWAGSDPNDGNDRPADNDEDGLSDAYESEVSTTDPGEADSDGDGLSDAEEILGLRDRLVTDALDADTDDDGLLDGSEGGILRADVLMDGTDPRRSDSDGDGLLDSLELGRIQIEVSAADPDATASGVFQADLDPGTTTDPLVSDTDGDGLSDGEEDQNADGVRDADETDPAEADSDGDGLDDGWEHDYSDPAHCAPGSVAGTDPLDPLDGERDPDGDGLDNRAEYALVLRIDGALVDRRTSPCASDTDDDGVRDDVEVASEYRRGASDPTAADTDGDGLSDGLEDRNGDGRRDERTETDPTAIDTDGDGLSDGVEDRDLNGELDDGETDPRVSDSDQDGLPDAEELRFFGTAPRDADSDADGLPDGLELSRLGDADPRSSTDALASDTDQDGLADGIEDANQNGRFDPGETHPRLADTDGDGLPDGREDSNGNGTVDRGESDPRLADTDGGGVDDGREVLDRGTDPMDPTDDRLGGNDAGGPGRGLLEDNARVRGVGCGVAGPVETGAWGGGWGLFVVMWLVRHRRAAARGRWLLLGLTTVDVSAANAQEHPDARAVAFDASPYRSNPSGQSIVTTPVPQVLDKLQWQVTLAGHAMADPIAVTTPEGAVLRPVVRDRMQLELGAALGLFDRVELAAQWAVAVHQVATYPGQGLGQTSGAGAMHPVLRPKIALLREPEHQLSLGAEAVVTLAFWKPAAYMGHDGPSVQPNLLASRRLGPITLAAATGIKLQPRAQVFGTVDGHRLVYQLAVQYTVGLAALRMGLEWSASHRLGDLRDRDESTGQLAGSVAVEVLPRWCLRAIAGAGVLGGLGQARYRGLLVLAYGSPSPAGADEVGRGPASQGCQAQDCAEPELTPEAPVDDGDSFCVDGTGGTGAGVSAEGCQPIAPSQANVPDAPDPCSAAGEAASEDCASLDDSTSVAGDEVVLHQRIGFAKGEAAVQWGSVGTLADVLAFLDTHHDIRIQIKGHADGTGHRRMNRALSRRRARSVLNYFIEHSRDPEALAPRLSVVASGESEPLESNETEVGRAHNRRVEFVVVQDARAP